MRSISRSNKLHQSEWSFERKVFLADQLQSAKRWGLYIWLMTDCYSLALRYLLSARADPHKNDRARKPVGSVLKLKPQLSALSRTENDEWADSLSLICMIIYLSGSSQSLT